MRPLTDLSQQEARCLSGLLFDLDDTALAHGRLVPETLALMYRWRAAGLHLIGVTGRPTSWGQVLVRQWPVTAMIVENGIIAVTQHERRVVIHDRLTTEQRETRRVALARIVTEVEEAFPELRPTDDVRGRWADATFDIGEARRIPAERVGEIVAFARRLGARAVASSVHLHLQLDIDDKATGALRFLTKELGVEPVVARKRFAFIGDSGNDAACFAAFYTTCGVKNLSGQFSLPPRYGSEGEADVGFREFVNRLIELRA